MSTREVILRAAQEVVAELGPQHLTLDAVYKHAGISKGGLLYHFPSKEALLAGMVGRYVSLMQAVEDEFKAALGDDARGVGLRAAIHQAAADDPDTDRLGVALLAAVANDLRLLEPLRVPTRQRFEDMKKGDIPFETAAIIDLALNGLAFLEMLRLKPLTEDDKRKVLVELDRMAGGEGQLPKRASRPASPLTRRRSER